LKITTIGLVQVKNETNSMHAERSMKSESTDVMIS